MHQPSDITLHSLTTGYAARRGHSHVVGRALSARAASGTLTCLIGRNGTGKSTLLRTVAGLQPPLGGSVCVGGEAVASLAPAQRARRLAIVLTARPDAPNITVAGAVALGRAPYTGFWGRLSPQDAQAASRAMQLVGIAHMARRRLCSLSDGELQRAMIAKAIAQDTPCILLDEPTAFLDFPAKIELMALLRRLARDEGKTVLLSTHDIETALQTADSLWLLDGGTLSVGSPRELARSGAIGRYIGRPDVRLDPDTLALTINGGTGRTDSEHNGKHIK